MERALQKKLVEEIAWEISKSYLLESDYNTDFLAEMIRRKFWHPEEGIMIIAKKTGAKMKKLNKKGDKLIDSTAEKNLERLEGELENSPKVTSEMGRGYLISNIVKAEAKAIKGKLEKIGE